MSYDLEKYRDKRDKVLGVKKRGVNFGTMAMIISVVILMGLGATVIPKSAAYWQSRNLDDAIFKVLGDVAISGSQVNELAQMEGVRDVKIETAKGRIVITFDRTEIEQSKISALLRKTEINTVLLNRVSHASHMKILKKEAEF